MKKPLISKTGLVVAALLGGLLLYSPANGQSLQDIRTFDVEQFHDIFELEQPYVRPEIYTYIRTALERENRLRHTSPADGLIHLSCGGFDCSRISAQVRAGDRNGPVVWETEVGGYIFPFFDRFYSIERNSEKIARIIIDRLADDYAGEDVEEDRD
jgi:hypothetical protein